jgi:rubrerythrin
MQIDIIKTEKGYMCEQCGYKWVPRIFKQEYNKKPRMCPVCKSPDYDKTNEKSRIRNSEVRATKTATHTIQSKK